MDSTHRELITVFCADDHAGFRDTLRELIGITPGFVLIGEASSGADAIALVPQLRPDLVLIDVHMPGMSGFEAAARLASDHEDLLVVLMSADPVEIPRGFGPDGGQWTGVTKQELCRHRLLELWQRRRESDPPGSEP